MTHRRTERIRRARKQREGIVLLITAFVLMIVAGTAFFAIQQGMWEMRSAGNTVQAMRTRYVAESFVMAGLACVETQGCLSLKPASDSWRAEYGVPDRDPNQTEPIYEVRPADANASMGFVSEVVQTDDVMSGGGIAAMYQPDYRFVVEQWILSGSGAQAGSNERIRYVASCYGELDVTDDLTPSGDLRGNNESLSVTRAYYQTNR